MRSSADVELLWQKRVGAAKRLYAECSRELLRLVAGSDHDLFRHLDVRQAIRQACEREKLTRNKYMRALRIYTHLVVYGTMPKESASKENHQRFVDRAP